MTRKALNYNIFKTYLPPFAGILLLLWLSLPENISSADDAYTFSRLVRDQPAGSLFLPRYPIYLPIGKSLYLLLSWMGFTFSAHDALAGLSMISSAAAVVLSYHLCYRWLDMSKVGAAGTSLLLLFSWGFWRYSVEAELYAPSTLLLAILMWLLFRIREQPYGSGNLWWQAVAVGLLAILFYKPNSIPVLVCLPWILSTRKDRWKKPVRLIGCMFAGMLAAYFLLGWFSPDYDMYDYIAGGATVTGGNPLVSLLVILSNQLSFLWIFSLDFLSSAATGIWPEKVLSEEMYLQNALTVPPWMLLALVILTLGYTLVLLTINRKGIRSLLHAAWSRVLIAWILLYAIMLLSLDPVSAEPWIMIQLPLVFLAGSILFEAAPSPGRRLMAIPVIILIFINNLVGGMLLIADEKYDYIHLRGEGLAGEVTNNDVILTFGPGTMEAYLAWQYPARVINLEQNMQAGLDLLENGWPGGSILVLADVLQPDPAIRRRMEGKTDLPKAVILEKYELDTLYRHHQFSTFELRDKVK